MVRAREPSKIHAGPRTGFDLPHTISTAMADDITESLTAPTLYSVEEAADVLGIGRTYMFHLLATGAVESFKIGKRRKISREALDAFVKKLLAEQRSAYASKPKNKDRLDTR